MTNIETIAICKTCNHNEHLAGLCSHCNCGESEIVCSRYQIPVSVTGNSFCEFKQPFIKIIYNRNIETNARCK